MNTPKDGTPHSIEESPPSPTVRRGYPEHNLVSILLMGLVSAAVFYGVAWSVQEQAKPVHTWDFRTLTAEESPWQFPRVMREQNAPGVTFMALKTDPGPELVMDLDTDTVREIRATVEVTHYEDGTPARFSMEWYWASAEDVAAAEGDWPYSGERGTPFKILDRHAPNTHGIRISRHKRWNGSIARGFVAIKFPPSETGPFQVRVLKIEFLE